MCVCVNFETGDCVLYVLVTEHSKHLALFQVIYFTCHILHVAYTKLHHLSIESNVCSASLCSYFKKSRHIASFELEPYSNISEKWPLNV